MTDYEVEIWTQIIKADQQQIKEYGYSDFDDYKEEEDD